jgi:hypothetical protein
MSPSLRLPLIFLLRPDMRSSLGCGVPARLELLVLARSQEDAPCPYLINIVACILPVTTSTHGTLPKLVTFSSDLTWCFTAEYNPDGPYGGEYQI